MARYVNYLTMRLDDVTDCRYSTQATSKLEVLTSYTYCTLWKTGSLHSDDSIPPQKTSMTVYSRIASSCTLGVFVGITNKYLSFFQC